MLYRYFFFNEKYANILMKHNYNIYKLFFNINHHIRGGLTMNAPNIAYYFLLKANHEGDLITNLKLQKLLYYAQAWHLINFKKPLFREKLLAWELGPVVREVYQEFKKYGGRPININGRSDTKNVFGNIQKDTIDYLEEFYDIYIGLSAHELVNMTHNEEPWKRAYKNNSKIISLNDMEEYYQEKYKESE